MTAEPETYVEMELISEPAAVEQQSQAVNSVAVAQPEVVPAARPVMAHTPEAVTPVVATTTTTISAAVVADMDDVSESVAAVAGGEPSSAGSSAAAATTTGGGAGGGNSSAGTAQARGPRSILPPRILQKTEPRYPEQARREGAQGTVAVKMEILENGQVGGAWVQQSSGYAVLDEAALESVQQWRFVPARNSDSGQAIRCSTVLSVVFRLNQ
jgi:protein TonB